MLRILGWQLALTVLSFGLGLVTRLLVVVLGDVPAITAALASGVSTAFQAWFVIVMVILYESQRLRSIEGQASSGSGSTRRRRCRWAGASRPRGRRRAP